MSIVTLTPEEARVLGCLMEKAVTTPDNYPLSLNAVVTACNQTTNREPIVSYNESVVEAALDTLREKELIRRVKSSGQRVIKYRHVAEEALVLDRPESTLLGVLLLRGAQTPGELKQRTERWHSFRSLADVEDALARLATAELVLRLERRPGQKESRWTQLLAPVETAEQPARDWAPRERTAGDGARAFSDEPARPSEAAPAHVADREPEPIAQPHSLEVRNPATGEVVRSVAITEPGEVALKVARARRAQPAWAARPYAERAGALRAFRTLLEQEAEECAQLTTSEVGKPIRQSRNEIRAVLERIDWNVEHAGRVVEACEVTTTDSLVERITYEPVGVVAHVSAWNYPYFVGLNSIVPALLVGNAVCYKPSEHATLTGLRLVDLLHRSGVPVDLVHAIVGAGPTGAALVEADVDMVCFTGSYATGRRVAAAAADRLARVQLELGGKDAAYVCDDVSIDDAAMAIAEGAFYNAGQSCSATERVYVHEAIWDAFNAALVEAVSAYTVGDPTDGATDIGPLARAEQIDVLEAQLADAVQRGAKILCGGDRIDRPGNWFAPTIVIDVAGDAAIMRDESFGPVIGVARVSDDADALARMDDTEYGLGASVFTPDRERAQRLLGRLEVGNAYWNTADRSCVRLPWSGRRHSGLGTSMSESGVRAFVREKAWHLFP
jgi:acyl-CoA reductase-like NAD-dependent aldehyde dehydrogenase